MKVTFNTVIGGREGATSTVRGCEADEEAVLTNTPKAYQCTPSLPDPIPCIRRISCARQVSELNGATHLAPSALSKTTGMG